MGLVAGTKLGPYEILSPLGAGGMGEVYRARDTRLGRDVAVKVLPEGLGSSPDFRQRFEREARVISSLQHPHICVLHDIGRDEAAGEFLVMELLEGETVAERLKRGKLPLQESLKTGMEMADALDKAHRKGVVHRDLKPSNIMLTQSGGAKLMDFGLAKPAALGGGGGASSAPLLSAAMTADGPSPASPITSAGSIIGTIQYMSPEQIEGKEADARSDIFAFGATLYEMATGVRAFPGKSQISVASAILEKDPEPISKTQPLVPAALDRVIAQCLAKNPDERFQSAHDLEMNLKWISVEAGLPRHAESGDVKSPLQRAVLWAATLLAGMILAAFVALAYFHHPVEVAWAIRSFILLPEKGSFQSRWGAPLISPDGTRLVFVAGETAESQVLWLRPLDSLTAQPLPGTGGAVFPFWSADSRFIGFFQGDKLRKIDASGGQLQTICDSPGGRGGTWNRDDVIVFEPGWGPLYRVPAAGGTPTKLTDLGPLRDLPHRFPSFLPDGRHFVYWGGNPFARSASGAYGIYLGSLDSSVPKLLFQADSNALYAPPGYLLFVRGESLMAQPFDAQDLKLTGDAFTIAEHVTSGTMRLSSFSVSQNGILAYQTQAEPGSDYFWFDASGKQSEAVAEHGWSLDPRLSPDGKLLAEVVFDQPSRNFDIWLDDVASGVRTRFTFNPAAERWPVWSPDGSRIVFASDRTGHDDLYVKNSTGAGNTEVLLASDTDKVPTDWSRDGRFILFTSTALKGKAASDIWVLPLFGDKKPFPFLGTEFDKGQAVFSPDGHWVAYQANDTGNFEIYIAPFPGPGGKWKVSQGGGTQPAWRHDGRGLHFLAPGGKLMEAEVSAKGSAVEVGAPKLIFQTSFAYFDVFLRPYDVAPDGKRFLVLSPQNSAPVPITLVANWSAGFKK